MSDKFKNIHPELKNRAIRLMALVKSWGYEIEPCSTYRSFAEQSSLYAQGRTKKGSVVTNAPAGFSPHNYGCAIDFCLVTPVNYKGVMTKYPDVHPVWNLIGKASSIVGVEWGGSWKKFQDRPHIEVPLIKWGRPTLKLMGTDKTDFTKVWSWADKVFAGAIGGNSSDTILNSDSSETWNYIVKSGDNLSKIAEKYLGDSNKYLEIIKENKLTESSILSVGQVLKMPKR